MAELKSIDKKSNDRIKNLEESHRIELQKLKDVHEAAEKLRRERWIEEKTKKIKELTVRGLEPEIQKLIAKHKTELGKMKTVHEAELLAADERASQRYIRMTEDLRNQLEREKESAIARERDSAREKYEKALRDEEKSFAEQRRRLYAEIEDEKNRQADLTAKQRADLDKFVFFKDFSFADREKVATINIFLLRQFLQIHLTQLDLPSYSIRCRQNHLNERSFMDCTAIRSDVKTGQRRCLNPIR